MEELEELMGTKTLQPTCSETSLNGAGREGAPHSPVYWPAANLAGAVLGFALKLQLFSPDRVTERRRAGSTAGVDPSAMQ